MKDLKISAGLILTIIAIWILIFGGLSFSFKVNNRGVDINWKGLVYYIGEMMK